MEGFLKAVGALNDETRVLILKFLSIHGKSCVCELEASLEMLQPRISRHLKILKEAGFLEVEKEGTWYYYSLAPKDAIRERFLLEIASLEMHVPKKICVCDIAERAS